MTSPPRPRRPHRIWWVVIGVIVWLILASSITLELGEQDAAKWVSTAVLIVILLGVLIVTLWATALPVRAAVRRIRRRRRYPNPRTRARR